MIAHYSELNEDIFLWKGCFRNLKAGGISSRAIIRHFSPTLTATILKWSGFLWGLKRQRIKCRKKRWINLKKSRVKNAINKAIILGQLCLEWWEWLLCSAEWLRKALSIPAICCTTKLHSFFGIYSQHSCNESNAVLINWFIGTHWLDYFR